MRHRISIPVSLGAAFTVGEAAAAGVGRGRAAASDLSRPFHGIRSLTPPTTPRERVLALAPRLHPGQLVGGATALRFWGYPYPTPWRLDDPVHVVVATGAPRLRTAGVAGLRLAEGRARRWTVSGVPIVDPVAALFMCVTGISDDDLVVLLDAMVTHSENYPGLLRDRPVISLDEIALRLVEWGRFPGCRRIRLALAQARGGVESPKETETRLLLTSAGLPEPEIQFEVVIDGQTIARTDLAYPIWRIAMEYEGDGHRTSRDQWRRDIQRQRRLEASGWLVIRITQLDLASGASDLLALLRRAIAARAVTHGAGSKTPPSRRFGMHK